MRAIIIDDHDARALMERLELAKFKHRPITEGRTTEQILDDVHGHFRYIVVSWLTEQGCTVVR